MTELSHKTYRQMIGRFTTGVAVVLIEPGPVGLTVNSLTSLSLEPLLLLFCARKNSTSVAALSKQQRFSVNLLTEDQMHISRHFAGPRECDLAAHYERQDGWIWLARSNATFLCDLTSTFPGGDHEIIVGQIRRMLGPERASSPLVFHEGTYRRLEIALGHHETHRS